MSKLSIHRIKYFLIEVSSIIMTWVIAALVSVYIKFNDIPDHIIHSVYHLPSKVNRYELYQTALVIGLVLGVVMSVAHVFLYPLIIKSRNFLLGLLFRLVVFTFLTFFALYLFLTLSGTPIPLNSEKGLVLFSRSVVDILPYLLIVEMINGLNITLRRNLGRGYFNKLMRNTYFSPRNEYRVFMFIDLKNSTPLADRMGSLEFSRFIQKCFSDFSATALDFGAEIYQFVGDEVIISWLAKENFKFSSCMDLHFAFQKRLKKASQYYLADFGTLPEFRSSIHCGSVSAALVGVYKSEIAYHGSVLNLCSRLQTVCRQYDSPLVISEDFYQKVASESAYRYEPISGIELKGVSKLQLVYKVMAKDIA